MKRSLLITTTFLLAGGLGPLLAKKGNEVPLTPRGAELEADYSKQLESLRAEVIAALPEVDAAKRSRFRRTN